ncbi:MAG: hypothetical protein MI741_03300 [Rhodospirillales bacterium]|nr:hypothetical protein [Rhodospirillales bacterium]
MQTPQPNAGLISKDALAEFKRIYRDEYGEDLSDREATDLAINLVLLYQRIYRPLPEGEDAD